MMPPMVMMAMAMPMSKREVESNHRPGVVNRAGRADRGDVHGRRHVDRSRLHINRCRLNVNRRRWHHDSLRHDGRLVNDDGLNRLMNHHRRRLVDDRRVLDVNRRRGINWLRFECFRQKQASSYSGEDFASDSPFFVSRLSARRGQSNYRQGADRCYGCFHTITTGFDERSELLFSKRFPGNANLL